MKFCLEDFCDKEIARLKRQGDYRYFNTLKRNCGSFPTATWLPGNKQITIWCSNDYLAMGQNPQVIAAMHEVLDDLGAGAGGTRNISGTTVYHVELESALAAFHGKEAGLVFNSGYSANYATLGTLGAKIPDCVIISDQKNHASIIEGIRQSQAHKIVFRHNDLNHLEEILANLPLSQPKLIVFESVYSMDGDFGKIGAIVALAKKYNAFTYLDEVHGVGLYGKNGAGVSAEYNLTSQVDIIQGTLGKAIGLVGGYIVSSRAIIDYIRSMASGFIFTTSLPPVILAGALASLRYIQNNIELRETFWNNVRSLKATLRSHKINFVDNHSHITPLIIGDASLCLQISKELIEDFGIYLQPINYPTVARGSERFRITISASHSGEMIEKLAKCLQIKMTQHQIQSVA